MATFFVKTSEGLLKVGGKVTMENIVNALGYVPADKAELDNYKSTLDNISSSADDALIVSDSSGNIIMKVDSNGLETTNVKSSYSVETEILTANIINSSNDNFVLADASNNIIMKVDSNGLETTNVKSDTSETGLLQANTVIADNIENSGEFYVISDIDGNIIVKIDALGLHTTNVDADIVSADTIDLTDAEIDNLTVVQAIVASLTATDIEANAINTASIDAETANISSINSDSAIITSISSGTIDAGLLTTGSISSSDSVFALSDESGDMILKVDVNGLETTTVTADKFVGDLEGNVTGNASTSSVASKVANKLSINTSHGDNIEFDGSSEKSITITAASLGLTQSMLYIGTSTTEVTDGGNEQPTINGEKITPSNGNVTIYNNKEFIYNGSSWELLGDEMNHKVLQSPVSDPTANGEKTTEFISNITQDANGNIIAIKKTVDTDVIESSLITVDTLVANNIHNTGDNYVISDGSGRMIMQVDANGVKTTNVYATEDATIEGDLTVNGNITGNLTGDLTGNVTGTASLAEALTSSAGSSSKPVYFKDGKPVQTDTTLEVSITGNAETATTATNLAVKPTIQGDKTITVTAGNKTSDAFTVPFATNSTNATNASLAEALTSNAGSSNKPIYFDGGKPVVCNGPIQLDVDTAAVTAGTVTATEKVVTPLIEHDGSEYAFADKDGNMLVKFSSDGITTTKVTIESSNDLTEDNRFFGDLKGNVEGNVKGDLTGTASLAEALTSSAGSSSKPVYFKDGKPVQTDTTLEVSITGNAETATTATNLAVKPTIQGDKAITVTAGNKTSDPFTVPFATSATNATNASLAEALTSSAGSSSKPVYFKDGKPVQTDTTLEVSITGNAETATTATNLAVKPTIQGDKAITVTAGNKTSDPFTVPFATSATNATNASLAEALTSSAGSSNKPIYFDSGKPVVCNGPIQLDVDTAAVTAGTVTATEKVVTPLIEHDGSEYAFADKDGNMLVKFSSDGITTTKVTIESSNDLTEDNRFFGDLKGNVEGNVKGDLTGTASLAAALTSSAGSSSKPVYFKDGMPTEISNIDWGIVSGKPTIATTAAGKHKHTGTPKGVVTSTFEGTEFNTNEVDDHTHSVIVSGTVESTFTDSAGHTHTFTANEHKHTFEINVAGGETAVSGDVTSTFTDTVGHTHTIYTLCNLAGGHTHTITADEAGGHTHTITVPMNSDTYKLSDSLENGVLTLTIESTVISRFANCGTAGGHTHTITANTVNDHNHTIDATANNQKVSGDVTSAFDGSITIDLGASSGSTSEEIVTGTISDATVEGNVSSSVNITTDTTAAGKHMHAGTPTGVITSTFAGNEFTTTEVEDHTHNVSLS